MAGIIASELNNLVLGVIGVAPQVTFLGVKVLDQYGAGYLSDVINGLQWVYNNNGTPWVKLVNMSIGFSNDSPPLRQAIQSLYNSGVIMVASAGNRCAQPRAGTRAVETIVLEGRPACDPLQRRQVSGRLPQGHGRGGHRLL